MEQCFLIKKELIKSNRFKQILEKLFRYRIISLIAIIFMSTFKADFIGADTPTYIDSFNKELYWSDFGYSVLQSIVFKLGLTYRAIWFVVSLFTSIVFVIFINKFSANKRMSFILFVTLGLFSQSITFTRQIVAIDFLLLELIFIEKEQWKLSVLCIIFAFLFHRSGLIGIVFIVLKFVQLNWITIAITLVLTCFIPIVLPFTSKIINYLGLPSYYEKYFEFLTVFIKDSSVVAIIYSIGLLFIFIAAFIFMKYIAKVNKEDSVYYWLFLFLFASLFRILGLIMCANSLFDRLSIYFFPMIILIIPRCLNELKHRKNLYHFANIACYFSSFCFMFILNYINYYNTFPFVFGF